MSFTLILGVRHFQTIVDVPPWKSDLILDPGIGVESVDVVVVAEFVAFVDTMVIRVGIIEVVDKVVGSEGDVAVGERVDIDPEFTAEQVAYSLVVGRRRVLHRRSSLKGHEVVEAGIYKRIDFKIACGVDTVFKDVTCSFFVTVGTEAVSVVGKFVDMIEVVPVDLRETLVIVPKPSVIFALFGWISVVVKIV